MHHQDVHQHLEAHDDALASIQETLTRLEDIALNSRDNHIHTLDGRVCAIANDVTSLKEVIMGREAKPGILDKVQALTVAAAESKVEFAWIKWLVMGAAGASAATLITIILGKVL